MYHQMMLFVEGRDDSRLVECVIKPLVQPYYDSVAVEEYAHSTAECLKRYLRSLKSARSDYLFFTDIDESRCIPARRQQVAERYTPLSASHVIVVRKEIESWYMAGLDSRACGKIGLKELQYTDNLTKEGFLKLQPKRYDSRVDFMQVILQEFSVETAKQKNGSFRYLARRLESLSPCDAGLIV